MKENYTVCNCMQVSYHDIVSALENHNKMEDVEKVFKDVQDVSLSRPREQDFPLPPP